MSSAHHHSHGTTNLKSIHTAFYIGIALNLIFTLVEFIVGYTTNSLALIADATHNLSDVASLVISLIGMRLAQKASTKLYTYGYKKASIMASLVNAILLIVIVVGIAKEALARFYTAPEVVGKTIILTALIGVLINTISAFLFYKRQKDDINIKGAFLHLLVDALISLGVVVSGIIIYYTNWNIIDPIISLVIAIVILISTWGLLKESIKLALDGVPQHIDINKIASMLKEHEGVQEIHHLHIWALSSNEIALTVHLIPQKDMVLEDILKVKNQVKEMLLHQNIQHATIEFDDKRDNCHDQVC